MSNKQKTGGPAFPVNEEALMREMEGMTLRDYFAAKAMQGMLTDILKYSTGLNWVEKLANESYAIADAMLKARQS